MKKSLKMKIGLSVVLSSLLFSTNLMAINNSAITVKGKPKAKEVKKEIKKEEYVSSEDKIKEKIKALPMFSNLKNIAITMIMPLTNTDIMARISAEVSIPNEKGSMVEQKVSQEVVFLDNLNYVVLLTKQSNVFDSYKVQPVQLMASLPLDELKSLPVAFEIGEGKKEFFVFTDPDCPACHQLEQFLKEPFFDIKKTKIKVIYNTLDAIHPNAASKALYILSHDPKERLLIANRIKKEEIKIEEIKSFKYSIEAKKTLELHKDFSNKHELNSTPMVFNEKGVQVNPAEMFENLEGK
jgi:protein-disulfide isomerase